MERTFRLCPYLVCGQIEIGMDKDGTLQDYIMIINIKTIMIACVSLQQLKIAYDSLQLMIAYHMQSEAFLNLMNFPRSGTNKK